MSKTYDVESMIRQGKTREELIDMLNEQIDNAEERIEQEDAKSKEVEETREDLIDAILYYAIALGIIDETEFNDKNIDKMREALRKYEKSRTKTVYRTKSWNPWLDNWFFW